MSYTHKVGDVCLTTNTELPAVNDGVLVVVLKIDPTIQSIRGEPAPYLIRRVDGQPFTATSCARTGRVSWCKRMEVFSAGYKLKPRVNPNAKEETCVLERVTS